jgi:hypothetical protein
VQSPLVFLTLAASRFDSLNNHTRINVNNSISKLLSSAALVAAIAAPAFADTVQGSDVDVMVNGFTPISSTGNSFTFSGDTYVGDGWPNGYLSKTLFAVYAHEGKVLTGKMSFTMELQYDFAAPPPPQFDDGSYTASAAARFSLLAPVCLSCGPLFAEQLGTADGGTSASATSPTSGTMSFTSNASQATGRYNHILADMVYNRSLGSDYGSITITSLTISFDTIDAASPVPELPPFAMMGAGLAVLGLSTRLTGRRKQAKAALPA